MALTIWNKSRENTDAYHILFIVWLDHTTKLLHPIDINFSLVQFSKHEINKLYTWSICSQLHTSIFWYWDIFQTFTACITRGRKNTQGSGKSVEFSVFCISSTLRGPRRLWTASASSQHLQLHNTSAKEGRVNELWAAITVEFLRGSWNHFFVSEPAVAVHYLKFLIV